MVSLTDSARATSGTRFSAARFDDERGVPGKHKVVSAGSSSASGATTQGGRRAGERGVLRPSLGQGLGFGRAMIMPCRSLASQREVSGPWHAIWTAFSDATFASAQPAVATYPTGSGVAYQRSEPERTLLHRIVRENLASFLAEAAERYPSSELPHFIACEFERYLRCGLLCHGFVRVRCPTCRDELLVAFSCKNRGVCPSCSARRMADTAAHLRDLVWPDVPVRQFVMTIPKRLRFVLAWWPKLISLALNL